MRLLTVLALKLREVSNVKLITKVSPQETKKVRYLKIFSRRDYQRKECFETLATDV